LKVLALISALLLTYYRPLIEQNWLQSIFAPYANFLDRTFNGGTRQHGIIAWCMGVLLPVVFLGASYILALLFVGYFAGFLISFVVLYFVLRFSYFGQHAEKIGANLKDQNIAPARQLLAEWENTDTDHYNANQIASVCIETTFKRAHQGMFAPILWFALLGPAGALLYRLAHILKAEWSQSAHQNEFYQFSQRAFYYLDWLPARVTAACFAVVGDFEDAAYCWRTQANNWPDQLLGMVLASGTGAMGVKLVDALPLHGILQPRPDIGLGDEADADYVQAAVGLVWRVLLLMVGLLILLTFAHWLGA
jgi:adenosylcobinamide-phosphate synthase